MSELIGRIKAINLGLEGFGDGLRGQGVPVRQIDWRPPVDAGLLRSLEALSPEITAKVEAADQKAIAIMLAAEPHWVGIRRAIDVVPGMKPNLILHSGPPNDWEHLISTQKKGVVGGALHAGLAKTEKEAVGMIQSGEIELGSCNDHFCVGAGAGIVTANMVVNVSRDLKTGLEGYCIPFEGRVGLGVWGVYNPEVERNLREIEEEFGPAVTLALEKFGAIDVRSIIARSMQMGDDIHTRQTAAGLISCPRSCQLLVRGWTTSSSPRHRPVHRHGAMVSIPGHVGRNDIAGAKAPTAPSSLHRQNASRPA